VNLIVLLPNEEGTTGSLVVTNAGGSQQLTEAYTGVKVERADAAPSAPMRVDPDEVHRLFHDTLATIPSPEVRFTLYFPEAKTVLTPESESLLPRIFQAYQERHSTDVSIIGHTDTIGSSAANFQLGLARAEQVKEILERYGVKGDHILVESHGKADLLVPTPDNVAEPRNRRVEVIVR
jgi:outer membrane protein OmpA-like peptidoglycan-associated protein